MGKELKCFDVAYLEQITEELLHYKVEPKTIYRGVPIDDFISLVRRMREVQERAEMITGEEDMNFIDMLFVECREAEREVDEYLKKMEV